MESSEQERGPLVPLVADSAPRLRLVLDQEGARVRRISCHRIVTLLGTRPGCKLNLRHRKVDPVHLALVTDGSSVLAVDMVTPHGTHLNGLKLEHERLTDGDAIELGPWTFHVEIIVPAAPPRGDAHPFALEPSPRVFALEHTASHRILQPTRDVCVIGRRPGCDICLTDSRVSRVHAILFCYFGQPVVCDLLSRNNTFVNGTPIVYQMLQDGDSISLGDTTFCVRLVGSAITEGARPPETSPEKEVPKPTTEERPLDSVDIQATEGALPWRIADNLERLNRNK